jgi:hypothetical protein
VNGLYNIGIKNIKAFVKNKKIHPTDGLFFKDFINNEHVVHTFGAD